MKKMINNKKCRILFLVLFFSVFISILLKFFLDFKTPAPLVYLVPEAYVGPVYVFFGQKDGVELKEDILGKSVTVPDNGLIKIREPIDNVVGKKNGGLQNIYWVRISTNGARKKIKIVSNLRRDNEGNFLSLYYDEEGKGHKFPVDENSKPFYYFSEEEKSDRMIFAHEGCKNQRFMPRNSLDMEPPNCGKFLVMSPNEFLVKPNWIWRDLQHSYSSIDQLKKDLDEIRNIKHQSMK